MGYSATGINNSREIKRIVGGGTAQADDSALLRDMANSLRTLVESYVPNKTFITQAGLLAVAASANSPTFSLPIRTNDNPVRKILLQAVVGEFDVLINNNAETQSPTAYANLVISEDLPAPLEITIPGIPILVVLRNRSTTVAAQYSIIISSE